jgi:hypothetical protein
VTSAWICERCWHHNPVGFGVCQNPGCGGEPVSRAVDARSRTHRQCFNHDGSRKEAFARFDEAQEECFRSSSRGKRKAAYPCSEHGFHVGSMRAA